MIRLRISVPFGSFRKSYARSFAETYAFPPPTTVYGMLLSLVGERSRARHAGVRLAFAYARQPRIATTLRKLSRYKYGVPGKQSKLGNAPDFIETLCDIDFLCWVDSAEEVLPASAAGVRLEDRIRVAINSPSDIQRCGIVCLGLSDDAVDDIAITAGNVGAWRWLAPDDGGDVELPVWVDHVGSKGTRWQRFRFLREEQSAPDEPGSEKFVQIEVPTIMG